MADSRKFPGDQKPQGGDPVQTIDPTSAEGITFLETVLPREESKLKGDTTKRKVFEENIQHEFKGYSPVFFSRPISRRKKMYDVCILGENEELPSSEKMLVDRNAGKPNVLYFKKTGEQVKARGIYEDKVVDKILTSEQVKSLESHESVKSKQNGFVFNPRETYQIPDTERNHKKISEAMKYCGFVKYIYTVEPSESTAKVLGEGSYGKVVAGVTAKLESKEGKLELKETSSEVIKYIDPQTGDYKKAAAKVKKESELARQVDRYNKDRGRRDLSLKTKKATFDKRTGKGRIVMGEVKGYSLDDYIAGLRIGQFPALNAESYEKLVKNTLASIDAVHNANVFHRDINSKNIMVDPSTLSVQIIDFGLAQEIQEIKESSDPPPMPMVGTPDWASPEMGAHSPTTKKQHDVYSVGVNLRLLCRDTRVRTRQTVYDNALAEPHVWRGQARVVRAEAYLGAEYFLNIPMGDVQFPENSPITQDPSKAAKLQKVLNGITATRPEERLSPADALVILNTSQPEEEKRVIKQPQLLTLLQRAQGYFCLLSLAPVAAIYLLGRLATELEEALKNPDIPEDVSAPFKAYLEKIKKSDYFDRQKQRRDYSSLPDLIVLTREVLDVVQGFEYYYLGKKIDEQEKQNIIKYCQTSLEELDGITTQKNKEVVRSRLKSGVPNAWRLMTKGKKKKDAEANRNKWGDAWNATFLSDRTLEECWELSQWAHFWNFLGVPYTDSKDLKDPAFWGKVLAYVITVGPLLIPLKNLVKLVTEFPLKKWSDDYKILKPLHWLVRAVTSPITNYRESKKVSKQYGWLLRLASCVVSAVGLIGIGIAAAPLIAAIVPEAVTVVFSSSVFGGPMGTILSALGYAPTNHLIGSAVFSLVGLLGLGCNGVREEVFGARSLLVREADLSSDALVLRGVLEGGRNGPQVVSGSHRNQLYPHMTPGSHASEEKTKVTAAGSGEQTQSSDKLRVTMELPSEQPPQTSRVRGSMRNSRNSA